MSKIKDSGLDQYSKVQSLNGIGDERVKVTYSPAINTMIRQPFLVIFNFISKNKTCLNLIYRFFLTAMWLNEGN